LHILVKDLTGAVPVIELYDNEGNVEDTYPVYANSQYGVLYNWYAAADARNITSVGWHVPTKAEFETLITYCGGGAVAGGVLKETGIVYWNSPNTGATNLYGFNGRGAGQRHPAGIFLLNKNITYFWSSPLMALYDYNFLVLQNNSAAIAGYTIVPDIEKSGFSLRPIKDATTLTHGQTGTYTGNDGLVYNTICIGTQEWLSESLKETKFRNGVDIPIVTDNAAWAALTTAGMCYYKNDVTYV